eukprot:COSAG03_NODE_5114_length_1338_cov_1.167877_1_plen_21_part_10
MLRPRIYAYLTKKTANQVSHA